jgi:hypothetical protein
MSDGSSLATSLGVDKPEDEGASPAQPNADGEVAEEPVTTEERLWWALMGMGCTWFINDTMFLQLAWWISSQPEGLLLGNRIALSGSIPPVISAAVALTLRKYRYEQVQRWCMPTMITFSIAAGTINALGLWELSSNFIYVSMALASTVGGTTPYLAIPWVMGSGYKPACISPMFLGGSIGSLCAATLALYQSPGTEKRFSPSVFFGVVSVPLFLSLYAYTQVTSRGIGKKVSAGKTDLEGTVEEPAVPPPDTGAENGAGGLADSLGAEPEAGTGCQGLVNLVPTDWDEFLPTNWRRWIDQVWVLAAWMGTVAMCTWTISRAVMGFASTHTVFDHHICHHLPQITERPELCSDACWEVLQGEDGLGLVGCERHCHELEWSQRDPSEDDRKYADAVCQQACEEAMGEMTDADGLLLCSDGISPALCDALPSSAQCCEDEFLRSFAGRAEEACGAEPPCTPSKDSDGLFKECRENRGEKWVEKMTALAQWAYTAGIGMTIVAPSFNFVRISAVWVTAFGTLFFIAMVGDGSFETSWAGYVVVGSALMVRAGDGYMGIMVFRYIAAKHNADEQSITVFFGIVAMVINFFGSIVSTVLVESGVLAD